MVFGIVEILKKFLMYMYYKIILYNKKVVFKGIPDLDRKVTFEGYNAIYPGAVIKKSFIGRGSYVGYQTKIVNSRIGRYCTIADNVRISLGRHPSDTFVSIHPAFFSISKQGGYTFVNHSKYNEHVTVAGSTFNVEIGNDVWIANNVLIMDGVTIGDGAIVAAGAIVTKDIEPYAIVGGIPAKLIRYRFSPEEIKKMNSIKWWTKDSRWISERAEMFDNIQTFINNVT
ncbi:MAG: CatB-related O-acetyltransferase [Chitinophagaceae bacterium]